MAEAVGPIGKSWPCWWKVPDDVQRFRVIGEMHRVREFRLVLCVHVSERDMKASLEMVEEIVEVERKNGRLDYLLGEPLIVSELLLPETYLLDDLCAL
jgi:hypothetical protein